MPVLKLPPLTLMVPVPAIAFVTLLAPVVKLALPLTVRVGVTALSLNTAVAPPLTNTGMLLVTGALIVEVAPLNTTWAPPLPNRLSWLASTLTPLTLMFCPPPASSVMVRKVGPGMLVSTLMLPLVVENSIGLVPDGVKSKRLTCALPEARLTNTPPAVALALTRPLPGLSCRRLAAPLAPMVVPVTLMLPFDAKVSSTPVPLIAPVPLMLMLVPATFAVRLIAPPPRLTAPVEVIGPTVSAPEFTNCNAPELAVRLATTLPGPASAKEPAPVRLSVPA